MERVVGRIVDGDLDLWRFSFCKVEAIGLRPDAYGADQIEQALLRHYRLMGELSDRHRLPPGTEIDPATGVCVFDDEEEEDE